MGLYKRAGESMVNNFITLFLAAQIIIKRGSKKEYWPGFIGINYLWKLKNGTPPIFFPEK